MPRLIESTEYSVENDFNLNEIGLLARAASMPVRMTTTAPNNASKRRNFQSMPLLMCSGLMVIANII